MLKVVKFGGSSLAEGKQFKKARDIIRMDAGRRIVVVSAPGKRRKGDNKITDLLYLVEAHLKYGVSCENVLSMIEERYREICSFCDLPIDIEAEFAGIRGHLDAGADVSYIVSRGEYLSAKLMAKYLGYAFVDSVDCVYFGYDGSVDREKTYQAIAAAFMLHPEGMVLPGFYGAGPDGSVKCMSRGGSDITGALAAASAEADVYENWTDVSGILVADPRIVKDPQPIERITYNELRELSYMGAEVLHEEAVFPVRDKRIPLNIRNTNDPEAPGTIISESFVGETEEEHRRMITGISGRRNYTIISVYKARASGEIGIVRRALELCERYNVSIEHIPSGIDSFSLVIAAESLRHCLYELITDLKKHLTPDSIAVTEGISLIAAVGRRMMYRPGTSGRLFATLGENGINIRMITQGTDELNIIVGVENKDFEKAINVLYNSFVR